MKKSLLIVAALAVLAVPNIASAQAVLEVMGGNVCVGCAGGAALAPLEVRGTTGIPKVLVNYNGSTVSAKPMFELRNVAGNQTIFRLLDGVAGTWDMKASLGGFVFNLIGAGTAQEMAITPAGDLKVQGNIFSGGTQLTVPDYVFKSDYQLKSLDEVEAFISENGHLPNIPSAADIKESGQLNVSEMQMKLLEKIEELTLYTLAQERRIAELEAAAQ